jgi:uncharacterized protein YjiS (DUF1127 family)
MESEIRRLATLSRNRPPATREQRAGGAVLRLWRAWRRRRDLRRLAEFDDRMLRDIGISRGEVERALASPFWHDVAPDHRAHRHRTPS